MKPQKRNKIYKKTIHNSKEKVKSYHEIIKTLEKMDDLLQMMLNLILTSTKMLTHEVPHMFSEQYKISNNIDKRNLITYFGLLCKSSVAQNREMFNVAFRSIKFNRKVVTNVIQKFMDLTCNYDNLITQMGKTQEELFADTTKNNAKNYQNILANMKEIETKVCGNRNTLYGCCRNCKEYYNLYRKIRENLIIYLAQFAKNESSKYKSSVKDDIFQNMVLTLIIAIDRVRVDKKTKPNSVISYLKSYIRGTIRNPPFSYTHNPIKIPSTTKIYVTNKTENIPTESEFLLKGKKGQRLKSTLTKGEKFIIGLMFRDPTVGNPPTKSDIEIEIKRQSLPQNY